jgi:hypothetical protein
VSPLAGVEPRPRDDSRVVSFAGVEPPPRDGGSVVSLGVVGLVVAVMLTVVAIDAGAYLAAASRAQTIADSAALAAAIALDEGRVPTAAAVRVVEAAGLQLEECRCDRLPVEVEVSSPVNGLVVPQLTARRVVALSTATVLDS